MWNFSLHARKHLDPKTFDLPEQNAPAPNYWGEVQHIQNSDIGLRSEIAVRYAIIVMAGAILVYASSNWVFGAWAVAYLLINGAYSLWLSRMHSPVPRRRYIGLIAMNMISSSVYASVPIYMWLASEDLGMQALGLCGIIGLAIYNLARHTRYTVIAWWDLSLVATSATIVGGTLIADMDNLAAKLCIGFGTMGLILFYHLSKAATIRDREALASSREELIEAQKQATMGQITAGVAHDFNNKLTAIQGNIELAALTHDPSERASLLREARKSALRAADVVAHMQAFVRKSPLNLKQIELRSFGHDVQRAVQPHLPESISMGLEIDDGVDCIVNDPRLLETALLNLVLNARDAMDGHGGRIHLRVAPGDLRNWSGRRPAGYGPFVRFDVSDEGGGLPVSQFRQVQEPFFTSKPAGMGTGLGLSMVKGFAEQIGGALMLRNRPTGGLEVSLIFPVEVNG